MSVFCNVVNAEIKIAKIGFRNFNNEQETTKLGASYLVLFAKYN
jgi:hypothetical protein